MGSSSVNEQPWIVIRQHQHEPEGPCTLRCPAHPDHAKTLPPFSEDGYVICPDCQGKAKHFNCGCVRCDEAECFFLREDPDCAALDLYGAAFAPWT